jgi:hypothetical protein
MTSNTLHRFKPILKFWEDRDFIYVTVCRGEHKEDIQSYYKLTEEYMEEITKEWTEKILIPVKKTNLSDPDLIRSPVVTHKEYDAPSSSKNKNKEKVQELNDTSEETTPDSPEGGGGDEVDKEEDQGEEENKE